MEYLGGGVFSKLLNCGMVESSPVASTFVYVGLRALTHWVSPMFILQGVHFSAIMGKLPYMAVQR
jgi:hypothetical protein